MSYDLVQLVKLVKPDAILQVENRILNLAKTGKIQRQVTEDQVKELLASILSNKPQKVKVSLFIIIFVVST